VAKPLGACSSRQASQCSFYAKEPSKPTRVFSSGAAERQCSFVPEFDVDKFDLFGEPVQMCLPEPDEESMLPGAPRSPEPTHRRAMVGMSSRQVANCTFYAKEPSKATQVFSSAASERCSFLDTAAEFDLFAPSAKIVFEEDVGCVRGFKLFVPQAPAPPCEPAQEPEVEQWEPDPFFNVSDFDLGKFDVFALDAPQMPWPDQEAKRASLQEVDLFTAGRSLVD